MRLGSPIRHLAQLSALTLALSAAVTPMSGAAAQQSGSSARPGHAADDARIRAVVAEQVAAWNAGDAKTFSLHFAEDGSFTNIQGAVFYGHRAFEDRHVEIFRTFFKGTTLAMTATQIRFVHPDVAIADIATVVSQLGGRTSPGVQARADGTFTRGCSRCSSDSTATGPSCPITTWM